MKKVTIEPGCTACGVCAFVAPEVFVVHDLSSVKPDADITTHARAIKQAAQMCPVSVIQYQEE